MYAELSTLAGRTAASFTEISFLISYVKYRHDTTTPVWSFAGLFLITYLNTLRTGDADLRFYVKTVQDGWRKSAFLTRACFPCKLHLIMQLCIINKPLLLHLVGCLYYLYQWCTVKQISDNEIYLIIKYIKSILWRVSKRLSLYTGRTVPKV